VTHPRTSAQTNFLILLSFLLYLWQGYGLQRQQTLWLFASFLGLLVSAFLLVKANEKTAWRAGWLFRLGLLAATPWLSDDYARFVWDGRLLSQGWNPYLYLPAALVGTPEGNHLGLTPQLYQLLNSPHYYTVYPPFNQALFGLSAWLSGGNLWGNIVWLRVWILLAEAVTAWLLPKLLKRLGKPSRLALAYWLHPLVILELTGNVHFEAVMVALGLLAAWLLVQNRLWASATAFALAVVTKLIPLVLGPLLIRELGWKRGLAYGLAGGGLIIGFFAPFVSAELIRNFGSSVDLYFQKFEFNASVYYLVRQLGYWLTGYNIIQTAGPLLSLLTLTGVVILAIRRLPPAETVLLTLSLYFAFATTVHPWYLTTLVAVSVLTNYRFPLVWAAGAFLSYATYRTTAYTENLWLTGLEYGSVILFAGWEYRNKKARQESRRA